MRTYTKHVDGGHGWLRVPLEDIKNLGLYDKISHYSYFSTLSGYAYLEEDIDADLFRSALMATGSSMVVNTVNDGDRSFIRNLNPWL